MIDFLENLVTEKRNDRTKQIDSVRTYDMLKIINDEDKTVAFAIEKELDNISKAVDVIYEQMKKGGRLIYCGAGTSGRLGLLDAVECPPTYGVDDNLVIGLLAGGYEAVFKAKEGAEDNINLCEEDLRNISFNEKDVLVGIAASGRTPYVLGGLEYAGSVGAQTVAITCNPDSPMSEKAKITIAPIIGPEVVTGSTRMKSGTAQKMILNMLSTGVMIKSGKVYGNLMVDVKCTNEKLVERAKRIVMQATGVDYIKAEDMLEKTKYDVKLAIVAILTGYEVTAAKKLLNECEGRIAEALKRSKVG